MRLRKPKAPLLRVFFATDLHGSEICFRKALAAPGFYDASLLIIGGDLSGKAMIPTFPEPGGRAAHFLGRKEHLATAADEERFARHVADGGYYVWPVDDPAQLDDEEQRSTAFRSAVKERLTNWMRLADERLTAAGLRCYMAPGNDDEDFVDEVLATSSTVVNGEGQVLEIADGLRLASCGWSNPTPWRTHREEPEEALMARMHRLLPAEGDGEGLLLNFHVPPQRTNLDVCAALDENLKAVIKGGMPVMTSAGSSSTRRLIETRQPILSLHGHIHESKGAEKIGRTQCLNPGSTYGDGLLAGCLVDLARHDGEWRVERFLFTSG
jgi:Icc-related predicted phosphoesterase